MHLRRVSKQLNLKKMTKRNSIYINKKEKEAIYTAWNYVNDIIERCSADESTEEGKAVIDSLQDTISGLISIQEKLQR